MKSMLANFSRVNGSIMEKQHEAVRIRARNLRVAYDQVVAIECQELDLRGKVVALLGHNGAGKSTFIKTILGLLPCQQGELLIHQVNPDHSESVLKPEEHMAFCPETGSVFADIPVESYIKLWCRMKHGDRNYYKKAGKQYIELLSIGPLLKKLGRELSKGQRRRVQTAIGFLTRPKLFLFDEPFDGLDVQKTNELTDIIVSECANMSFVVSSHRMDVVERLCDVLIVLKEGQVLTYGNIEKVCVDLCKQSIIISNVDQPNGLVNELRASFQNALVNTIGSQICMTGSSFNMEGLDAFLNQRGITGAKLSNIRPSLVDAMNYHLKSSAAALN
jgi:ABC-2 type transport system ATP-binding protein